MPRKKKKNKDEIILDAPSKTPKEKVTHILENGVPGTKDLMAPGMIDRSNPDYLIVDDKYVRNFMVTGYPKTTQVGWANEMYDYDGDLDLALHIVPMDDRQALDELTNKITQFQAQLETERQKGSNRNITKLQAQIAELVEERRKAEQNYVQLFSIQMIMNLFCDSLDALKKESSLLTSALRGGRKVKLSTNYLRQDQGYKSALPYGKTWLPRNYRNISSEGLTGCFPFYNSEISHPSGTMIGENLETKTPIYIDFYDRRILPSGNTTVFGMTGTGKTFLVSLVTMRSTLNGVRTAIIDPEGEFKDITETLGGINIRIARDGEIPNPFDVNEEDILDDNDEPTGEKVIKIKEKIADVISLTGVMAGGLTNEQYSLLTEVAARLYEAFGITEDPESIRDNTEYVDSNGILQQNGAKKKMPTFTDFHNLLEEYCDSDEQYEVLIPVKNALKMFRREGVNGMFDCETPERLENLRDAPIVCFDVSGLEEDKLRPIGMYIALSWCMEKFSKQDVRIKKRVICDEAWMMVKKSMAGSEYTAHFLENCARRIRKRNGTLMIASQKFKEFVETPEGEAILSNALINIFLKHKEEDLDEVQNKFKLSNGEKDFIAIAPVGHFLIKIGRESARGKAMAFSYEKKLIEKKRSAKIRGAN